MRCALSYVQERVGPNSLSPFCMTEHTDRAILRPDLDGRPCEDVSGGHQHGGQGAGFDNGENVTDGSSANLATLAAVPNPASQILLMCLSAAATDLICALMDEKPVSPRAD